MLWMRDRVINNASFKRGEKASSLHDLLDSMSHVEFIAYLTTLAGTTYTKKIVKNGPRSPVASVKDFFHQMMGNLLVLPGSMENKKHFLKHLICFKNML